MGEPLRIFGACQRCNRNLPQGDWSACCELVILCTPCLGDHQTRRHSSDPARIPTADLVGTLLSFAGELRWRVQDLPNPLYEDEGGKCRHDLTVGHSWRCVSWQTHEELRAEIRERVGPALFAVLDGDGLDVTTIEVGG